MDEQLGCFQVSVIVVKAAVPNIVSLFCLSLRLVVLGHGASIYLWPLCHPPTPSFSIPVTAPLCQTTSPPPLLLAPYWAVSGLSMPSIIKSLVLKSFHLFPASFPSGQEFPVPRTPNVTCKITCLFLGKGSVEFHCVLKKIQDALKFKRQGNNVGALAASRQA